MAKKSKNKKNGPTAADIEGKVIMKEGSDTRGYVNWGGTSYEIGFGQTQKAKKRWKKAQAGGEYLTMPKGESSQEPKWYRERKPGKMPGKYHAFPSSSTGRSSIPSGIKAKSKGVSSVGKVDISAPKTIKKTTTPSKPKKKNTTPNKTKKKKNQ